MKIETLSVTIGRTINLGNFNSLRIEASAAARIDNPDNIEAARAALLEECKRGLAAARQAAKEEEANS